MKIIVTGGKSAQAFKMFKAFKDDELVMADYGEMPASFSKFNFFSLGERNNDTIAHNLLNACLDQEANSLLPLHDFEVEAVAKSAQLFEEFNIHVLLPDAADLPQLFIKDFAPSYHWAVYNKGELLYTSQPWVPTTKLMLSGAFYIRETPKGVTTALFTIS